MCHIIYPLSHFLHCPYGCPFKTWLFHFWVSCPLCNWESSRKWPRYVGPAPTQEIWQKLWPSPSCCSYLGSKPMARVVLCSQAFQISYVCLYVNTYCVCKRISNLLSVKEQDFISLSREKWEVKYSCFLINCYSIFGKQSSNCTSSRKNFLRFIYLNAKVGERIKGKKKIFLSSHSVPKWSR